MLVWLALATGCAELTPLKALKDLDPASRRAEVEAHKVEAGVFTVHVGGHFLPYAKHFDLAPYYRDCGCPEAAEMIEGWDRQQKWVLLSAITGALLVAGTQIHGTDKAGLGIPGLGFLILGIDLDYWSRASWLRPSAELFDECLDAQLAKAGGS